MAKLKKPFFFALSLLPVAVVAGIAVGVYQLDIYPAQILEEAVAVLGGTELLIVVSAVQTVGYALFCGFVGYLLAGMTGLWKPFRPEKKPLLVTLALSVTGGIVFSLDHWVFGSVIDGIQQATAAGLTVHGILAAVLYGGVIEEVMLRLFFMSLLVLVIWKVFCRRWDRDNIPAGVFAAANFLAAILFAAGHLPATLLTFGQLTPLILLRCFLLNGGFGLLFGWLYRKYGIAYSMVSHGVFHIVSRLIWLVFV